jgi:LysR family transcriptional regulator, glycine cleavage system transcriptional activator
MHDPRPLPPLDFLRGFESAARHLSFTRAGEELFVTQSAVSRQIQALEEYLGVPLFQRKHKALALTEAGQSYYRTVAPMLDELREATRRLRETRTGHVLTVTTTVSFASLWLVPRLSRFRKKHPAIDVRLTATHEVVDLDREGIDIAVRDIALNRAPAGAIPLVGEQMAAICSPGYLKESKAAKRPLSKPEDLRHHILLQMDDPAGRWPWITWRAWLEAAGVEDPRPGRSISFNQYDQMIQAAVFGQGVALGRMSVVRGLVRERKLVTLFGREQQLPRAFHAVFAEAARSRPEARQFVDWMREELASDA